MKAIFQRDGLASLLQENKFALLILDACRWDTLQYFLNEEVRQALSPSILTVRWLNACWPNEYDITYITGIPHIVPTPRETDVTYDGHEHFEEVVYLGEKAWDEELKTVPPAPIRDAAIETDADRVIVHFLQPHIPYIGETRIDELAYGQLGESDENVPTKEMMKKVPAKTLQEAYFDNLERVWTEGVQPLLTRYEDRRVVITADHGELLGEDGNYGHGHIAAPVIIVPWVEVAGDDQSEIPWGEDPRILSKVIVDHFS